MKRLSKKHVKHDAERLERPHEAAFGHSHRPDGFFLEWILAYTLKTDQLRFFLFFSFLSFYTDMLAT